MKHHTLTCSQSWVALLSLATNAGHGSGHLGVPVQSSGTLSTVALSHRPPEQNSSRLRDCKAVGNVAK